MRRSRTLLLAATAGVALFASACGVTADTTAATVAGTAIPIDDVTTLVSDPVFNGGAEQPNESSQDGTLARSALMFLIERQAWLSELDRWGLEISDADREQIGAQIDEQAATGGQELDGRSRELLVEYTAAQSVLTERFGTIDPERDDDLRRLYDELRAAVAAGVPDRRAGAGRPDRRGPGPARRRPVRAGPRRRGRGRGSGRRAVPGLLRPGGPGARAAGGPRGRRGRRDQGRGAHRRRLGWRGRVRLSARGSSQPVVRGRPRGARGRGRGPGPAGAGPVGAAGHPGSRGQPALRPGGRELGERLHRPGPAAAPAAARSAHRGRPRRRRGRCAGGRRPDGDRAGPDRAGPTAQGGAAQDPATAGSGATAGG